MAAERMRRSLVKTVLPVLGLARTVASRFPASAIESKVTPEWLIEKGKKRFPELIAVIEKYGERGRKWLQRQSQEIVLYLTGRLVYDVKSGRMVRVERIKAERA